MYAFCFINFLSESDSLMNTIDELPVEYFWCLNFVGDAFGPFLVLSRCKLQLLICCLL